MATYFWWNIGKIGNVLLIVVLAFQNELQYCRSDFNRLSGMNFSELFRNLVRYGACSNPRVYDVKSDNFCSNTAKISISRQISQNITSVYSRRRCSRFVGTVISVCALKEKRIELSTSNLVHMICSIWQDIGMHWPWGQKVKGHGHRVMKRVPAWVHIDMAASVSSYIL